MVQNLYLIYISTLDKYFHKSFIINKFDYNKWNELYYISGFKNKIRTL